MGRRSSERRLEVLAFIKSFFKEHHCSPSLTEIQRHFGWASASTAMHHILSLEGEGYIARERGRRRALRLLDVNIQIEEREHADLD